MKRVLILVAGWGLMFTGAAVMLEASLRWWREAAPGTYAVTLAGFAACVAGVWLRKRALRRGESGPPG